MCAISGIFGNPDAALVERMNDAMSHRGPDDQGVFVDHSRALAIGHRRLSIIDPGTSAHQPMCSRDGRYRLVFNGEIYNYRALRDELIMLGHVFTGQGHSQGHSQSHSQSPSQGHSQSPSQSHSQSPSQGPRHDQGGGDTQVLLAAYAQWGAQCLHRLDGMFAFAIHDRDAHGASLFLARDRLGIKPLYYCMRDGDFLFASELKALLASERVARTLDPSSLGHYLSLGAMAQPATAIVGVHMLAPGHYLHVTCGESPIPRRYWELADAAPWNDSSMQRLDREEASAQVRRLLDDATRRHLVADVDVGAFLSGGMDSSAIVALMSPLHSAPIKTFSVGFENSGDVDERIWARRVAERFETDHSEVVVTGDQVAAQFDRIISSLDQPSLDGTNTWLVAQAAGVSVKVALSGVGGDELFAGYEHFRSLLMAERYAPCMAWLTPRLRTALTRILPRRVRAGSALLGLSREQRFQSLRNLDVGGEFASERLRTHRAHHALAGVYAPWMRADMDTLRQTSYLEVRGYLLNTLLRDIDAMAMAHSLEVRPLLLDHHLVEYVFALPSRLKVAAHVNKPLLADAVRDLLPQELLRRRKRGFELPLLQWLNGPLRARASAAFNTEQARSVFAPRFLRNLTTQLRDGQCNSIGAWAWFCLLEWMQAQRCTLEL